MILLPDDIQARHDARTALKQSLESVDFITNATNTKERYANLTKYNIKISRSDYFKERVIDERYGTPYSSTNIAEVEAIHIINRIREKNELGASFYNNKPPMFETAQDVKEYNDLQDYLNKRNKYGINVFYKRVYTNTDLHRIVYSIFFTKTGVTIFFAYIYSHDEKTDIKYKTNRQGRKGLKKFINKRELSWILSSVEDYFDNQEGIIGYERI